MENTKAKKQVIKAAIINIMAVSTVSLMTTHAEAMSKRPVSGGGGSSGGSGSTSPAPTTPIVRTPATIPASYYTNYYQVDHFKEVVEPTMDQVGSYYRSIQQIAKTRSQTQSHGTDYCDTNLDNKRTFGERIGYMVELNSNLMKTPLTYVADVFQIPKDQEQYHPVSLLSHKMCDVTADSLQKTLPGRKMPDAAAIRKARLFAQKYNEYRESALAGNREGYVKLQKLWSRMTMCLAHTESLTTADSQKSENTAKKFAPSDYRRPAGVAFYDDPYQTVAASKLNIGLYQFGTVAGGDIQGCIRQWNQIYPTCQISRTTDWKEMTRISGSSFQTFNAFCGVNYQLQNFSVQVNTTNSQRTHPSNLVGGKLKPAGERCVSLHFASKLSYNHFGPLQNVMGDTIGILMNCATAGEI